MSSPSYVKVVLDNYPGVCFQGQTLAGRIQCHFNSEKTVRAIRIRFKGRARVRWSESRGSGKSRRTVHFTSEQPFFCQEYNLVEPPVGRDEFVIPPGEYSYPFSYILPQNLPSSFDGTYGNVRYSILATVDRPWKFDHEDRVFLNLVSLLDLNYLPEYKNSATISNDKMVSCFCWQSGPVTFNISLPITGYTPGQEINIGAYVENMSNVTAERVRFKIVRSTEYIAHSPRIKTRFSEDDIVQCVDGAIGAHGEKSWTSKMVIPTEGNYPNLLACNIINVTYYLRAAVVLPLPHTNLDITLPFMIGNIPIAGINIYAPNVPPATPPNQVTPFLPNPDVYTPSAPTSTSAASAPTSTGAASAPETSGDGFIDLSSEINPPSYNEAKGLLKKRVESLEDFENI